MRRRDFAIVLSMVASVSCSGGESSRAPPAPARQAIPEPPRPQVAHGFAIVWVTTVPPTRAGWKDEAREAIRIRANGHWAKTRYDFTGGEITTDTHAGRLAGDVTVALFSMAHRVAQAASLATESVGPSEVRSGFLGLYGFAGGDRIFAASELEARAGYNEVARALAELGLEVNEPAHEGNVIHRRGSSSMGEGASWSSRLDADGFIVSHNRGDIGNGTDDARSYRTRLDAALTARVFGEMQNITGGVEDGPDNLLQRGKFTVGTRAFRAGTAGFDAAEKIWQTIPAVPLVDDGFMPVLKIVYHGDFSVAASHAIVEGAVLADGTWTKVLSYPRGREAALEDGRLSASAVDTLFTEARRVAELGKKGTGSSPSQWFGLRRVQLASVAGQFNEHMWSITEGTNDGAAARVVEMVADALQLR